MLREPYQNEISLTCAIVYYWLRGSVIWLLNSVQLKSNSVPEWETIQNSFTKKMTRNDREWSRHQFWRLKRRRKKSVTVLNIRKSCVEIHLQLAHDLANWFPDFSCIHLLNTFPRNTSRLFAVRCSLKSTPKGIIQINLMRRSVLLNQVFSVKI